MNCDEFRDNWTDWREGWLAEGAEAMAAHRDECPACARYDRQMRRLVAELATLPVPSDTSERNEKVIQGRRRRLAATPRRAAVAATLVVGLALGFMVRGPFNNQGVVADPVELASSGEHRIAVAFESPREVDDVEFVVELPEGVELAGFPGQRTVRWQGRLAEGRSQLELPLRVSPGAEKTQIVTRVRHRNGERRLVVPLELTKDSDTKGGGKA